MVCLTATQQEDPITMNLAMWSLYAPHTSSGAPGSRTPHAEADRSPAPSLGPPHPVKLEDCVPQCDGVPPSGYGDGEERSSWGTKARQVVSPLGHHQPPSSTLIPPGYKHMGAAYALWDLAVQQPEMAWGSWGTRSCHSAWGLLRGAAAGGLSSSGDQWPLVVGQGDPGPAPHHDTPQRQDVTPLAPKTPG